MSRVTTFFSRLCRCCGKLVLAESCKFMWLFDPKQNSTDNLAEDIKNEMSLSWKVKLNEDDDMPQHLCPSCIASFKQYFNFRTLCIEAQKNLAEIYKQKLAERSTSVTFKKKEDFHSSKTERKIQDSSIKMPETVQGNLCTEMGNVMDTFDDATMRSVEFVALPKSLNTTCSAAYERNDEPECFLEDSCDGLCEEPECAENIISANESQIPLGKNDDDFTKPSKSVAEGSCDNVSLDEQSDFVWESDENEDVKNEDERTVSKKELLTYYDILHNPLACKYCCFDAEITKPGDVIFPSKEALEEHISSKHDPERPYTCPVCGKGHKTYQYCKWHLVDKHKRDKLICWVCGVIVRFHYLRAHVYFRHTIADFECETCGKKFKNISVARFNYHKRWHDTKKHYKCEFCPKSFVQKIHLDVHTLIHTKDYRIKCDKCGKGFKSQYEKRKHMTRKHGEAKPIKCLYCDERFLEYTNRSQHMAKLHGHVKLSLSTTTDSFKCEKCEKVFLRDSTLRIHMERGHCNGNPQRNGTQQPKKPFQRPPRKYACPNCPCRFVKQSALLKHSVMHCAKERPFQCDVCLLHYKTQSHLDIHKRTVHTDVKPFSCDICGKAFAYRFYMNAHRKFHMIPAKRCQKVIKTQVASEVLPEGEHEELDFEILINDNANEEDIEILVQRK